MNNRNQGCLSGFFEIFMLNRLFNWLQERFGYRSGSCMGCGCGVIMAIVFFMFVMSIIFHTNWFRLF